MTGNYYTASVRYDKIDVNGKEAVVTEQYLIDALSFTEAEERIHREMTAWISGDFDVSGLRRERLAEIVYDKKKQYDIWYKSVVCFVEIDDKSGKGKSIKYNMLVNADTFNNALANLENHLKVMIVPWRLVSMAETSILDVYFYTPQDEVAQDQ